jgi:hypothetical protein
MITFQPADVMRILPQIILCGFGILVMVLDPFVTPRKRSLLGWLALAGVLAAAVGTLWTSDNPGLAFGRSIAADHFSFYFFYLFLLVAALTVLGSINYLERDGIQHGEFYALILMGTAGMCFMASSTDLIMVFIGLEISSISTYILVGFKRKDALANEASLKYFLLGSFATAFFLYGIAFVGVERTACPPGAVDRTGAGCPSLDVCGSGVQAFHCPVSSLDAGCLSGSACAGDGIPFGGPENSGLCRSSADFPGRLVLSRLHQLLGNLGLSDFDHVPGQSCGALADQHQEAAGLLGHRSRRLRFGRGGRGKPRGCLRGALLPHRLRLDECRGICVNRPPGG